MEEREIKTISFGQACRDRLGMYLSADKPEALFLALRELYVNSLDALVETNQATGNILIKISTAERKITVSDDGPGIPLTEREDGISSLVAAYTLPHTGSHFDNRATNAIGVNGVGGSVVNHTSTHFQVIDNHNGKRATAVFLGTETGAYLDSYREEDGKKSAHGVEIEYIPDAAIYGDAWFNKEQLKTALNEMMLFYPKYTIILSFDGDVTKIHFPLGLKTYGSAIYYESENLILALAASEGEIKPFGNRLYLPSGGAFFSHFKTQLTKIVNELSGLAMKGPQIQKIFNGYVAVFVSNPLFSNQSKTAISNKEVNTEITSALRKGFSEYSKTTEWKNLIKKIELEIKAEEAAEKARAKVKNALDTINKHSKKRVSTEKLKDCLSTGEEAWLAICEGDSAQGALNLGRDIKTVATIPIRGKFVNCLKNPMDMYLNNDELQLIASLLGCGLFQDYNNRKLKYGKVLIAVDADSDGLNIACLLITFFYVCLPQFIKEGRLYWMKAPLFTHPDGRYIFTEEEWGKIKNKSGFKRNKGLGEMTPEEVEGSLFGAKRQWVQLMPKNWDKFAALIEDLMGKDVKTRRSYLFQKVDFERIKFM